MKLLIRPILLLVVFLFFFLTTTIVCDFLCWKTGYYDAGITESDEVKGGIY